MGGGASRGLLTNRQVILVGAVHFLGGTMMRIPWWRLPLMEPPRASTMKLTRNLRDTFEMMSPCAANSENTGVTGVKGWRQEVTE